MGRVDLLRKMFSRRQKDLTVLADRVSKSHNLGALVRTADAVGCFELHFLLEPNADKRQPFDKFLTSSKGSSRWMSLECHECVTDAFQVLRKEKGMQIISADLTENSVDFRDIDWTIPSCLVVGKESTGVDDAITSLVDHTVTIPMHGMVESLNVSVATGIILYEAERQRRAAGMYEKPQLSASEIDHLILCKMHPHVYEFCLQHSLPFPSVAPDGSLSGEEFHSAYKRLRAQ